MEYIKKDCPYFEENCPGGLKAEYKKLDCQCAKYKAYIGAKNPDVIKEELKNMNITADEKLDIMLSMQKQFANRFHKVDGLDKNEIDHWTNCYLVCIEDEVMEAEEFLDIYPQRIKEFNLKEYRKELIDILHFIMDGMIVCGMTYNDFKNCYGSYIQKDLNQLDLLDILMDKEWLEVQKIESDKRNLYILNYILRDIRLVRQCINWKHWKKPSDTLDLDKMLNAYMNMFRHLIQAFLATGMVAKDVYDIYIQKNIENVLRQKYNY